MKIVLLASILCLAGIGAVAQDAANYQVVIDGKATDIALGKAQKVKLANGKELELTIKQKDILTYQDDWVSLQYPKALQPTIATPDPQLEQVTLVTANGNGMLLQKYKTINPTELVDLMLQEITEGEMNFGYTRSEEAYELKLQSGHKARGKSVVLKHGGQEQRYTVAAIGSKNKIEGIIFMTMLNPGYTSEDTEAICLFLDTLAYRRK
ncbi:hypothetical protein [Pontibacter oryzae]|nr:hypothetical protein [Pontibacter oryzae]